MTRINFGFNPKALTNEHLLAEHREIKRIPFCYKKSLETGSIHRIPSKFCLGTGHVLFFIDKPMYTYNRYKLLYEECLFRGFDVTDYQSNWLSYPKEMLNDENTYVEAGIEDIELVCNRIIDNINKGKKEFYHHYNTKVSKIEAIELIKHLKKFNKRVIL